ncbi:hypothetical protein TgHK011_003308 [Trichoderma gracile]|nr:hypothetical protein TgHK011_003308 [Trichoderma gracile]
MIATGTLSLAAESLWFDWNLSRAMAQLDEDAISSALTDVKNGTSQRKAAKRWGVSRTTLQKRLKGSQPRCDAYENLQTLSKEQESLLVQWVQAQDKLGLPPTNDQIKDFASRVVRAGGDSQPLGKRWVDGFLRRNPGARIAKGKTIDSRHLNGSMLVAAGEDVGIGTAGDLNN